MEISVEERRLVIKIIADLVNIKSDMAELILKPAGVPLEVYQPLLYRRGDEATLVGLYQSVRLLLRSSMQLKIVATATGLSAG